MPHAQPRPAPHNPLAEDLLAALGQVFGLHPGFRPVHAKGHMYRGTFAPTPAAAGLSSARHLNQPSTGVIVRLSDFAGVPSVADNDLQAASPRGMAIRFYLGEHVHTDIVGHSFDGFPAHNGEQFLEFLHAIAASGPAVPKPTPLDKFLAAHPTAMRFATAAKPIPTSYACEAFFGVSALKLTGRDGASRFGRYRIRPDAGTQYLTDEEAAKQSADFLQDEFVARLARGPVKFHLFVQLAEPGDEVNDPTVHWPDGRTEVELGTITLTERADETDPEVRKIIFDPIPRTEGLDPSDDPLWNLRADLYLLSGRRRRQADGL